MGSSLGPSHSVAFTLLVLVLGKFVGEEIDRLRRAPDFVSSGSSRGASTTIDPRCGAAVSTVQHVRCGKQPAGHSPSLISVALAVCCDLAGNLTSRDGRFQDKGMPS
ncbi:hypothetical protein E2562_032629 [Oryza meyeriana var. granulata]|uniref:Secreted protein n=1 Tax=Oryza meyeriana var. granulata TaxID=110450 RepID=A0A6G1D9X7_9ORYZ|nr:hypothetical protein E2562_032629 [Oryza meyeriana var. granulata]